QQNIRTISHRGVRVITPGTGELACGYEAEGRMAEQQQIMEFVQTMFRADFSRLRVLVSVGGTEEDLDPVRVITNRSSGRMGFALAEAARDRGALVTVVAGRTSVLPPTGIKVVSVRTTAEMSRALKEEFVDSDVLVMAAAVSDYVAAVRETHKKKDDTWTVELTKGEDILQALGRMKGKRYMIGFALETEDVEANAKKKLEKKNCDLMVVNNLGEEGAAFEHDTNIVTIYSPSGKILTTKLQTKREIADIIFDVASRQETFQNIDA
ncbi:MAG: bifunctional phosphopantothenoylcysteine decarboxylase/phosphopantothenate--cysteine ligase CoaBC, partial [bacterium]|nr:bifunctional phosphopantothenoylcysteine decarboxylase/phosphopantothenate--cysteine ligase CoaBC [bacterium]